MEAVERSTPSSTETKSARTAQPRHARLPASKLPHQPRPQSKSVRIALERLDRMMNTVGELVINRTRMVGRVSELEKLVDTLGFSKERLQGQSHRIPGKVRIQSHQQLAHALVLERRYAPQRLTSAAAGENSSSSDFSELEMDRYDDFNILSRSMAEISADVNEVLSQLQGFIGRVEGDIDEFTKLAHHLQDEFTAARMVPIGTLYSRLSRAVRDAAKSAGKHVDLDLAGSETELDNNIIQQISDPLVHLVRNSVAHGIEASEDAPSPRASRRSAKSRLRAYHRGNHIYIEVQDDGARHRLRTRRVRAPSSAAWSRRKPPIASPSAICAKCFSIPGFSTAPAKTELAGRGVGLDVVRANLNALNGEIEIQSTTGAGTKFT